MTEPPPSPVALPRRSRGVRWAIGVGAAAVTAIGLVLIFLLAQATNNRALYERNYARLFTINVVVAVLLMLVIGWVAFRLVRHDAASAIFENPAHDYPQRIVYTREGDTLTAEVLQALASAHIAIGQSEQSFDQETMTYYSDIPCEVI